MSNLMIILFLICLVCLVIGIIKPNIVIRWGDLEKRNRKNVLKYYGIGLIITFALIAVTMPKVKKTEDKSTTAQVEDAVEEQPKEKTTEEKAAEATKAAEAQKAKEEADAKAATKAAEEKAAKEKENSKIKAGTYKVGTDLSAGEYLVIAKSTCYVESSTDSKGTLESIVFNDNVQGSTYVTIHDGEYFKLQGGEAYPVDKAPSIVPANGLYKDGMYKVGKDIPAGEYKVSLNGSMGYLEVATDSTHQLGSIVTNDNVQADTYITVAVGQYLKLKSLQIQK